MSLTKLLLYSITCLLSSFQPPPGGPMEQIILMLVLPMGEAQVSIDLQRFSRNNQNRIKALFRFLFCLPYMRKATRVNRLGKKTMFVTLSCLDADLQDALIALQIHGLACILYKEDLMEANLRDVIMSVLKRHEREVAPQPTYH